MDRAAKIAMPSRSVRRVMDRVAKIAMLRHSQNATALKKSSPP